MSKGLRALKRIKGHMELTAIHWKQDVGYIEEELKALEIIKGKEVDVWYLMICIKQNVKPLQFYNEHMEELNGIKLTQEEYDLLKEVLE